MKEREQNSSNNVNDNGGYESVGIAYCENVIKLKSGLSLFFRNWKPSSESIAVVFLIHGLGEHSGRYNDVAKMLALNGYNVFAPDLRGHGKTSGKRGHVLSFSEYIDDIAEFSQNVIGDNLKNKPRFVLGHSMGGLIAFLYTVSNQSSISGLILSNPLMGISAKIPLFKAVLGKILSNIFPSLTLDNELNPEHVCSKPEVVRAYVTDPLVHKRVSTRWFTEMNKSVSWVQNCHADILKVPVLLLISNQDKLVDYKSSQAVLSSFNLQDKEIRLFDGLYHEILFEDEGPKIVKDIISWIDARAK